MITTALEKKDYLELEEQLSNPTGEKGIEIAKFMFQKNKNMIEFCFSQLELEHNDKLLEIGLGNGSHLNLLDRHPVNNIRYYGAEVSIDMLKEAAKNAVSMESNHTFNLSEYDGRILPYSDNFFNKIVMINAIYFIEEPFIFLSEMYRTLSQE